MEFPNRMVVLLVMILSLLTALPANATGGRLLGTGGATQVEGAAGGGLVPWAVMAGYGTRDEHGATATFTQVRTDDYTLTAFGAAWSWRNRFEISVFRQDLDIDSLIVGESLGMDVVGLKWRVAGDLVYTATPQLALGIQHKRSRDFAIPAAVGASSRSGTDVYLAASKLFLAGFSGHHLLLNATVRSTAGNQLGLLGFGGDLGRRHYVFEASAAVLLTERFAVGAEFRQKPDNLSFAREDHWRDVFVAWFPNKQVSLVAAWVNLGSVATQNRQRGFYLSGEANF